MVGCVGRLCNYLEPALLLCWVKSPRYYRASIHLTNLTQECPEAESENYRLVALVIPPGVARDHPRLLNLRPHLGRPLLVLRMNSRILLPQSKWNTITHLPLRLPQGTQHPLLQSRTPGNPLHPAKINNSEMNVLQALLQNQVAISIANTTQE